MNSPKALRFCLATMAILVGSTSTASATEDGWYYQLSLGVANFSSPLTDAIDAVNAELAADPELEVTGTGFVDDSDSTWTFAIGYRINPYVGLELAYVNLGKQGFGATTDDATDIPWELWQLIVPEATPAEVASLNASAELDGEIRSGGALVSLFGSYPINNFEFSGRLGLFFAKTQLSGDLFLQDNTDPTLIGEFDFDSTKSTMELMAGLGVGYTFFDHLQVRLDYSFFPDVGDEELTLETDVSAITAGVAYRF